MKNIFKFIILIMSLSLLGFAQTECPTVNPNSQPITSFNTVDTAGNRHQNVCQPLTDYNSAASRPLVLPNIGLEAVQVPNATSTGTTNFSFAKLTGAPSTAVIAATTDNKNNSIVGIVVNGGGTSGNATIAYQGIVPCTFANATTAGDFVTVSTGTGGSCNDAGTTAPTDGSLIYGKVLVTNASSPAVNLIWLNPFIQDSATGSTTVGSGTVTTAGTAVTNGTCQAQTAITVTGATTTDTAYCSLNAAAPATWQTGIFLAIPEVTSNTVTVRLCNGTAGSITPAAATVRCTVVR